MSLFDLSGKIAVVTGGTGVLGSAISRGLVNGGATVISLSRHPKSEVLDSIGAQGIAADVLDKQSLQAAVDRILNRHGMIDILINAAGGNLPQATVTPENDFFGVPADALQWVFNLNVMGSIYACQVMGKVMAAQRRGVILNMSSMASLQPLTRVLTYSAAKAALNNFTQWLAVHMAQEYSPDIRVNAIAPGFYLGEQNRYLLIDKESGDLTSRGRQIIDHTPMGRFGDPEDLVGTVVWLVSDASKFVTGIVVPVDGGFSAFSGV
ncbi:MAG: SDR family oxidoreductase [Chloroflexi bacterium]|nr:SDR family oxidoreductase [Chloroflexota bacterium]